VVIFFEEDREQDLERNLLLEDFVLPLLQSSQMMMKMMMKKKMKRRTYFPPCSRLH